MKLKVALIGAIMAFGQIFAGSGSSTTNLNGSYPIVLSHDMFGWGDSDTNSLIGLFKYWGGMDSYLGSIVIHLLLLFYLLAVAQK